MRKFKPSISVVMSVYNAEEYLSASIQSVLNQSYEDFEFIIINDGSTDGSLKLIQSFKDSRIIILNRKHDYISSLNEGISVSQGTYVARFDADDIMHPDRLKIQRFLFECFGNIDFCGTWSTFFDSFSGKQFLYSTYSGEIKNPLICLLKNNCFTHSTMMFKKQFLIDNNLFYEKYDCAEDYKLWVEAANKEARFYIEPQSLLYYRMHSGQISNLRSQNQKETSEKIKEEIMQYISHKMPSDYKSLYGALLTLEKQNLLKPQVKYSIMCSVLRHNNVNL